MASIEKNLNTSVPAGVVGIARSGIKPWSLDNMDDSTHAHGVGAAGAAVPSTGYDQTAIQPTTTRPGERGSEVALTDATQQDATSSSHPSNAAGAGVDNALGGAVNTRLNVNGPANTGQGADVATYGPADPLSKQGYSIMGE